MSFHDVSSGRLDPDRSALGLARAQRAGYLLAKRRDIGCLSSHGTWILENLDPTDLWRDRGGGAEDVA